jgi:hypothetical protein
MAAIVLNIFLQTELLMYVSMHKQLISFKIIVHICMRQYLKYNRKIETDTHMNFVLNIKNVTRELIQ